MTGGLRITGLNAAHQGTGVLFDVDLSVPEHALACVVGPSGCGKTTLLRVIAGFHRPTAGTVVVGERPLDRPPDLHVPAERRRVGYIPQDGALFPHLSVAANIGFGLGRSGRAMTVGRMLAMTDLTPFADRHPHQLSGGQQQRVALARALAPAPDLLLLDEPFTALDAGLRARVRDEVIDLLRSTGTTAILVTHDPAEALAVADQVTIINAGRVLQTGSPEELHARPATPLAARVLGDANVLAGTAADGVVSTALGRLPLDSAAAIGPVMIMLRPSQILIHHDESADTLPARVLRAEFRGEDYRIALAVSGIDHPIVATAPRWCAPDSTVHLNVQGSAHPVTDVR